MPDKYVCAECFQDYAIKEFIRENAENTECDYCENTSDSPIAVTFQVVLDFILSGIESEWEDPAESMGYESREGGYLGARVIDWEDLIRYEIEELFETNEDVLEDIVSSMSSEHAWCDRDPYGLRNEEALNFSWDKFSDQVKHRTRYTFLQLEERDALSKMDLDMIPIPKMLEQLSREISELDESFDIVRELNSKDIIYRARIHSKNVTLSRAVELSAPPLENAIYSNRMSPAGIAMFYGSFDPTTALKEIIDPKKSNRGKVASIARFRPNDILTVLDLCNLPKVPSLFDTRTRHLRSTLIFMSGFVADLSKAVIKDRLEHIEYVPTQVFTEYIRHKYTNSEGSPIDGILYPSSKNVGGVCCVLFMYNEQCADKYNTPDEEIVSLHVPRRRCIYLEDIIRHEL